MYDQLIILLSNTISKLIKELEIVPQKLMVQNDKMKLGFENNEGNSNVLQNELVDWKSELIKNNNIFQSDQIIGWNEGYIR